MTKVTRNDEAFALPSIDRGYYEIKTKSGDVTIKKNAKIFYDKVLHGEAREKLKAFNKYESDLRKLFTTIYGQLITSTTKTSR
eukprot:CAMPEP_0201273586 /NCGR_PEP_ID=MMETSP0853-20130426/45998_1 /ASSEMBLY_ACC=CAM_ASM_000640 /TAXON_ID=183588 /ORGANISM="Pseudo-nitzschia fraudulenta, Strain WWA7" /LENGTH=82 /DNA_ID=CAMNT_0047580753 /DNA_START=135 /DNA_END=383 /DNA_ORIENTATION=-